MKRDSRPRSTGAGRNKSDRPDLPKILNPNIEILFRKYSNLRFDCICENPRRENKSNALIPKLLWSFENSDFGIV
jgi:hypothetical protein